ncbi:hypothetical protein DVH05_009774 [Phytophthora capsici]|nr:hypothetical protein DVH05_009774 [Phytophthora capsici]
MRFCFVVLATVFVLLSSETPAFATAEKHSEALSFNNYGGTANRSLRSHDKVNTVEEERAIDADKLVKLLNPDDIAAALKNYDDEVVLFTRWWQHEEDVVNKLMERSNRMKNMPILARFNNFRTSMHYEQVLTPWLTTKDLDEVATALRASKMNLAKEHFFSVWHKSGVKPAEISAAIAKVENPLRRKGYGAVDGLYKLYVNGEAVTTARVAAKKTKAFAAKRAQAKKIAEAAAKRAQEIKTQKETAKKIADAAAKAAAKRTTDVQARKALAKKIAEAAAKRATELRAN